MAFFCEVLVVLTSHLTIAFSPGNDSPTAFRMVAGILRFATKYMVPILRTRAISHLSRAMPKHYSDVEGYFAKPRVRVFGSVQDSPHPFELLTTKFSGFPPKTPI
jgi:hypothetical protein